MKYIKPQLREVQRTLRRITTKISKQIKTTRDNKFQLLERKKAKILEVTRKTDMLHAEEQKYELKDFSLKICRRGAPG